jgi:glycerate-2-kinase
MSPRQTALEIFLAGVESVKPDKLIRRYVSVNEDILQIEEISFRLSDLKNIYIVGAGKASAPMALAIEEVLGTRITDGHIVTKYGHSSLLRIIKTTEAGHPVPDDNGIRGTNQILSIVKQIKMTL